MCNVSDGFEGGRDIFDELSWQNGSEESVLVVAAVVHSECVGGGLSSITSKPGLFLFSKWLPQFLRRQ